MNKKSQQRNKLIMRILAIILVIAMLMMTGFYLLSAFSAGAVGWTVYADSEEDIEAGLERLSQLDTVVRYIEAHYADDINVNDLTDAAYNGVFDALDRWSVWYSSAEEMDGFLEQVHGHYAGVGITMEQAEDGRCLVSSVNLLGPAFRARLPEGGVILAVDGAGVFGKTPAEIAELVRGDAGTEVTLRIEYGGEAFDYTLTREALQAQTVTYRMLEGAALSDGTGAAGDVAGGAGSVDASGPKIGYIAISQFSGATAREFRMARMLLLADEAEGLILDLRGNGGGVLADALAVANMLIPSGTLLYYETQGEIVRTFEAEGNTGKLVPLAVLTDRDTASASEALAGAVKAHKAGTLVGGTTFGKGVAQEIVTVDDTIHFKLSFCHFLTPDRKRIDGVGIAPDVPVLNGADLSEEQRAAAAKVLDFEPAKKYFAGQRGLGVLAAQQRLNLLGYDVPETGLLDEATADALKKIQAMYGACPYGGLDFCTTELVERAFREYVDGTSDAQLAKAIEVVKDEIVRK